MRSSPRLALYGGTKWYTWEQYNCNSTTTYTWNRYSRISTYKWNKYNAVSAGMKAYGQTHPSYSNVTMGRNMSDKSSCLLYDTFTIQSNKYNILYDNYDSSVSYYDNNETLTSFGGNTTDSGDWDSYYGCLYRSISISQDSSDNYIIELSDAAAYSYYAGYNNYNDSYDFSKEFVYYYTYDNSTGYYKIYRASFLLSQYANVGVNNNTCYSIQCIYTPILSDISAANMVYADGSQIYRLYSGEIATSTSGVGKVTFTGSSYSSFLGGTYALEQSYAQGSTSYGTVTSTSSSTYPNNGKHTDGYWYVYNSVSYSKGSTQYSDVSSTNRSAYPDNSYSGSYWYVYSTSSTSYSQGSTLYGTVKSKDESTYPTNGRHSDGYWYISI